jgi:hypothetical protein
MAEALVRIRNKRITADTALHRASLRGDVVVVMPDGHAWGSGETSHPEWRIFRFPGLPIEALAEYMVPLLHQGIPVAYRETSLNLDAMPLTIKDAPFIDVPPAVAATLGRYTLRRSAGMEVI